jgi:hypothetical protein
MISASQAFTQAKQLKAFQGMEESDFRAANFVQKFNPPAGGATTPFSGRPFPNGALVRGITASAYVPGAAAADGQSNKNRQLFEIDFAYTGGEAIVIDGPVMADALLGGGDGSDFPGKLLIIAPNQIINCRVGNLTIGALTVHVVYHCLVYRFAG